MKRWKRILLTSFVIVFIAIGSIVAIGYIRYDSLIHQLPLKDAIANIKEDPNYIQLEQVDELFLTSLTAIEDPNFYEHDGIVFSNIVKAFFTNIKEKELVMGGSTITQQLSKNIYLDQKKTFQRKIAEVFFVRDIENLLSKDDILELYINIIYFGDGYYGIKEASEGYFQTTPNNLSRAQATLLAGLPQAPAAYQLSDGMDLAKQRQRIVLEEMVNQQLLNERDAEDIYDQPV